MMGFKYKRKGLMNLGFTKKRFLAFLIVLSIMGTSLGICKDVKSTNIEVLAKEENSEVQTFPAEVFEDVEYVEDDNRPPVKKFETKALTKNTYSGKYGYEMLPLEEQKYVYRLLEQEANAFQYSNQDVKVTSGSSTNFLNYQDVKNMDNAEEYCSYYAVMVPLDQPVNASSVGVAVVSFLYDHPEYFWSKGYSYFVKSDTKMVTKVCLQCQEEFYDGNTRYQMWNTMDQEIQKYLDLIVGVRSDYEKELILHDAIAEKVTYAYIEGTNTPETERWAHTIESVFSPERGSAVCEGYAKAFQLLLNAAGIDCVYVVGRASGSGHAWNQVYIEKQWYNVDITWNDTGNKGSHKYFNTSDSTFLSNHKAFSSTATPTVGEWCYELNECTATEYSYSTQGNVEIETTYALQYGQLPNADIYVYNQGVEVKSGSNIEESTELEVVVAPKVNDQLLQVTTQVGEEQKYYEGVVGKDGISYTFSIVADTTISVSIEIPISNLALNAKQMSFLGYGGSKQLTATVLPANTTENYYWSSSDICVATVENGLVKAVGPGTAVISVLTADRRIADTCTVDVKAPYMKITTAKSTIKVGKTMTMKAKLYGTTGNLKWSVSNKKRATIGTKNGKLKAKKKGTVWVTVKSGSLSAKKKITIKK